MMSHRLFVYGSLMHPAALASAVPGISLGDALPAELPGFRRTFGVAFPNDGSQPDKRYAEPNGRIPPFVLFANLVAAPDATVNGIIITVDDDQLAHLRDRERRYDLMMVGAQFANGSEPVLAFLGSAMFTVPADIAVGIISREYLAGMQAAATHWSRQRPDFLTSYLASTTMPPKDRIRDLIRTDL